MGKCYVPWCPSGNKGHRCHLFHPPSSVLDKWKEVLLRIRPEKKLEFDSDVGKRSVSVCFKHFEESCIIKVDSFIIKGERVELPRDKWTLQRDAVPTIFERVELSLPKPPPPPPSDLPPVPQPRRVKRGRGRPRKRKVNMQPVVLLERLKEEELPDVDRGGPGPRSHPVDTNGHCFLCRNIILEIVCGGREKVQSKYNPEFSLRKLSAYLNIDVKKLLGSEIEGMDDKPEVVVPLCHDCESHLNPLVNLLEELEQIQNRVITSMKGICKIIRSTMDLGEQKGRSTATYGRKAQTKQGVEQKDLAGDFRKDLMHKCSAFNFRRWKAGPNSKGSESATGSQFNENTQQRKRLEVMFVHSTSATPKESKEPRTVVVEDNPLSSEPISASVASSPEYKIEVGDEDDNVSRDNENALISDQDEFEKRAIERDPLEPTTTRIRITTTAAKSQRLKCFTCGKLFNSVIKLRRHYNLIHLKPRRNPSPKFRKLQSQPLPLSSRTEPISKPEAPAFCPYCRKHFVLKVTAQVHILNKHRFQIFRKHLPIGTPKLEILSQVKKILREYRNLEEGKVGCSYCTRQYTQRDVELLVVQNHVLLTHFDGVVSKLKAVFKDSNEQAVNS